MRAAAAIARGQHGLVTRQQLLDAGLTGSAVQRWLSKGLLHRVHPGVYRLGHCAPSTEATYLAAVLAGGDNAALCGFAAAHLYGALRTAAATEITATVDVRLRGVIARRLAPLSAVDVRRHRGVPVTTPARTMVDLAGRASAEVLGEISHHLGVLHGLTAAEVFAAMARRGRVNGAPTLRALYQGDAAVLLGRLEREFAALVRGAGLPAPKTNRRLGSFFVDCRWPGLTVELLGFRFHGSRHAWTRDQRRAREAYARGDEFRAYTWDDVHLTPEVVLAELTPLLRTDRAA
jgi:hypothetical protein